MDTFIYRNLSICPLWLFIYPSSTLRYQKLLSSVPWKTQSECGMSVFAKQQLTRIVQFHTQREKILISR
jgi:hypothetical protein